MAGEPPFLEFIDRNLYPSVLESENSIMFYWGNGEGVEYMGLVFISEDGYNVYDYIVYEYDLERFKLAAKLLDDAERAVKIAEKTAGFIRRINGLLKGLPGPLAMAKLLNITGLLALRLEACSPGGLDEIIKLLEEAERDG